METLTSSLSPPFKATPPLEEDLIKVLGYELDYVRQQHTKLLAAAKFLLEQVERAEEDLQALTATIAKICKGEDWRDTPEHPRLLYLFDRSKRNV